MSEEIFLACRMGIISDKRITYKKINSGCLTFFPLTVHSSLKHFNLPLLDMRPFFLAVTFAMATSLSSCTPPSCSRTQLVLQPATSSSRHQNSPYPLTFWAKSVFFFGALPRVRHCLPLVRDCLIHAAVLALLSPPCLSRQEPPSLRPKYPLLRLIAASNTSK